MIGLNVHTAPVEMREKLAIPEAQWPQVIGELCALNHIEEAAVLSTCNRMEIYVLALSQHRGVREVTDWISKVYTPYSFILNYHFILSSIKKLYAEIHSYVVVLNLTVKWGSNS